MASNTSSNSSGRPTLSTRDYLLNLVINPKYFIRAAVVYRILIGIRSYQKFQAKTKGKEKDGNNGNSAKDEVAAAAVMIEDSSNMAETELVPRKKGENNGSSANSSGSKTKKKVAVNALFFQRLNQILRIIIPSVASREFIMLVFHTGFLILRTWLSVVVARLDGRLVKNLVDADGRAFVEGLGLWFGIAIPATFTNSMIKYLQSQLALAFRSRLTRHITNLYMKDKMYYKILNLDSRMENADQLIATDVSRFCDALAELYGNIGKPALDMVLFSHQLEHGIGDRGMGGLWWAYFASAYLLRVVTPPFGKMRAEEAKLEGDFRAAHSRIIINAEEIAFYGGHEIERSVVDERYLQLVRQTNKIYRTRIWFNMFEDLLIKYVWSTIGLLAQALPVFFPETAMLVASSGSIGHLDTAAARTQTYITNKRLMLSLADAGGRIMYSYKDLTELAGFTARVSELLEVFNDINAGRYEKVMVSNEFSLNHLKGSVETSSSGDISADGVPIITPNGDVLVKGITFKVSPGDHLMVTGPNGCGKSSFVRILAGLWPLFEGTLTKPSGESVFYVPQRPYLVMGTLRDQVIYPDTVADMKKKGVSDEQLMTILEAAKLGYIPEREGGWETVKEWKDVFSGGEKQRIGMARVYYHKPKYAVLDECTSAVSVDVEGHMYNYAKELGISLVTVSHRPSLFKYHKYLLRLDDRRSWTFSQLDSSKELLSESLEQELKDIRKKLDNVPNVERRLEQINKLLKTH